MSSISIIGTGNMAAHDRHARRWRAATPSRSWAAIGPSPPTWPKRSVAAPRRASGVPSRPGTSSSRPCCTTASFRSSPNIGDALAGKVIVDISNPFNSSGDGLDHPADTSIAQEAAKVAPASASR